MRTFFVMAVSFFICSGVYADGPSASITNPETGEVTTITSEGMTTTAPDGTVTQTESPFGQPITNYNSPQTETDPMAGDPYFGEGGALEGMTGGVSVDPATGDKLISVTDDTGETHTWGVDGHGNANDGAGFLPDGVVGGMRHDPETGDTFISLEAGEGSGVISETETFDPETGMTTIVREVSDQVDDGRMSWVRRADGTEESLHTMPADIAGAIAHEDDGTNTVSMDDGEGGRSIWNTGDDVRDSGFGDDVGVGGANGFHGSGPGIGNEIGFGGEVEGVHHEGSHGY